MSLTTVTVPQLLRHELRLWGRGFSRNKKDEAKKAWSIALIVPIVVLVLHLFTWPFALGYSNTPVLPDVATVTWLSTAMAMLFAWMVSQALNLVTQALYSRGDMELLLTAPISMRRVLTVRALAISMPVIFSWGFIILPLANWMAYFDSPHWLLAYPVMASMGLLATALGLILTMALFAVMGPRRTRVFGQILSVLIGASAFIALQARNVLPDSWVDAAGNAITSLTTSGKTSLMAVPVRALFGEVSMLVPLFTLALISFAAAIWLFGGTYAARAAAIAGATEKAMPQLIVQKRSKPFRSGVNSSLILKEWRLLLRDPWLLSQILLQLIYIIPMGFAFWKGADMPGVSSAGAAPMLVMLVGQLAGGLVWITISGEDAPDLVASAPISPHQVMRAKVLAATLPVAALVLLPLIFLFMQSASLGAVAAFSCIGAALTATFACLWTQKPRPRKTFGYRQKGSILANLAETALNFCWFFMMVAALWQSVWALLPLSIATVLMIVLYRWHVSRVSQGRP